MREFTPPFKLASELPPQTPPAGMPEGGFSGPLRPRSDCRAALLRIESRARTAAAIPRRARNHPQPEMP